MLNEAKSLHFTLGGMVDVITHFKAMTMQFSTAAADRNYSGDWTRGSVMRQQLWFILSRSKHSFLSKWTSKLFYLKPFTHLTRQICSSSQFNWCDKMTLTQLKGYNSKGCSFINVCNTILVLMDKSLLFVDWNFQIWFRMSRPNFNF